MSVNEAAKPRKHTSKLTAPQVVTPVIKDAAVGKGVFTLIDCGGKHYIHYNLPEGYLIFAVKVNDALAVEVNNFLADTLERERGKATRDDLRQFAAGVSRQ
jgi:hypothetical protein